MIPSAAPSTSNYARDTITFSLRATYYPLNGYSQNALEKRQL